MLLLVFISTCTRSERGNGRCGLRWYTCQGVNCHEVVVHAGSAIATSSYAPNISQFTTLNSTGDVDTDDDDATHFGLHVYGSGAPTGIVIDSGDQQV